METKTYPQLVQEILETLPEKGPLDRDDVRVWHQYHTYLVNLLEQRGYAWRGESFKNQGWAVLLVVKAAREHVPVVAFITGADTTGCMRIFLRQLEEGLVEWRQDQYK